MHRDWLQLSGEMEPQETGMSDFITAAQSRRVNNGSFNSSLDTGGSNVVVWCEQLIHASTTNTDNPGPPGNRKCS